MRRILSFGTLACLAVACGGSSGQAPRDAAGESDGIGIADAGGGDGGGLDGIGDGGTTPKRVFHLKNGTLGAIPDSNNPMTGLDVADQECTKAGQAYGGGQWKAWLSSSTANAIDRLGDVGPWYRLDGQTKLFDSRAAIANGPLAPISTQHDTVDDTRNLFWSGTLVDGTVSSTTCSDWRAWVAAIGTVGRVDTAGAGWIDPTPLVCSTYLALLCFEQ